MGSKHVRRAVLGKIALLALCLFLGTSCGETDQEPDPLAPPLTVSLQDLFGSELLKADGTAVGIEAIESKTIVAVFFGAGWCPHCTDFTPILLSAYESVQLAGKSFEVVHVSFDDSSEDMLAYMSDYSVPWLAVPFGGSVSSALIRRYGVESIPTLVVIDRDGNTISLNGRGDVAAKGAAAYDDWLAFSGGS